MSLLADINAEITDAMRAGDEVKVSTLRMLSAAVKNKQIEIGHELTDEEVLETIIKSAKQHRESIEAYKKGDRDDLAQKEEAELKVLEKYLPEQMNSDEVEKVVIATISELGASGAGDTGRVMGAVMAKLKGKVDGNVVSSIVKAKLS